MRRLEPLEQIARHGQLAHWLAEPIVMKRSLEFETLGQRERIARLVDEPDLLMLMLLELDPEPHGQTDQQSVQQSAPAQRLETLAGIRLAHVSPTEMLGLPNPALAMRRHQPILPVAALRRRIDPQLTPRFGPLALKIQLAMNVPALDLRSPARNAHVHVIPKRIETPPALRHRRALGQTRPAVHAGRFAAPLVSQPVRHAPRFAAAPRPDEPSRQNGALTLLLGLPPDWRCRVLPKFVEPT